MSEVYGVYIKSILSQKMFLSINEIGNNVKQILEEKIRSTNEGKCIAEGQWHQQQAVPWRQWLDDERGQMDTSRDR